jgi:hypothetical protein
MPIILPPPTTPTEQQAATFIALIDTRVPLYANTRPEHIIKHAYALYQERATTPTILACVGRLIAQYLPIFGTTNQWAFLVPMTCPPPQPISDNIRFLSASYFGMLSALHSRLTTNRPKNAEDFLAFAHTVLDTIIRNEKIPNPPWHLSIIEPVRRGYATLIDHYYAP